MTRNHQQAKATDSSQLRVRGALLAGVCAGISEKLGWNVWALRVLFIVGLLIQTLATGVVYIVLALLIPRWAGEVPETTLSSPDLKGRNERIADLERRFREMESGDTKQ